MKSLVDKMEGIIEIDSRLGEGSTFYITIIITISFILVIVFIRINNYLFVSIENCYFFSFQIKVIFIIC